MHGILLVLGAFLLPVPLAADAAPPAAGETPVPATAEERLARALEVLRSGEEGPARVAEEALAGPAAVRRAALDALGTLPPGTAPGDTLRAAFAALGSEDALLRQAGVRALLACGDGARAALEAVVAGTPSEGLPEVPRGRAADALFDLRRAAVEREFLALWTPEDGTFRGMFSALRAHGPAGARVLAAIALDRRMAGGAILGFGPYAWHCRPSPAQERSEIRYRALGALEDTGDLPARERLRMSLRAAPAPDLYDPGDEDPIPAALDDALRRAIAALGDPGPLREMIRASEESGGGARSGITELQRQAGAYTTLAESTRSAEFRRTCMDEAVERWEKSMRARRLFPFPADGVDYYNFACILARRDAAGDRARALKHLDRALDTYSVTADWVARDGDLSNLHDEPRFAEILQRLREREARLSADPPPGGGR